MATEKYFCFNEQGELKRMKGRIVRFLDNEDPTGSDKDAIRTSLEVSPDAAGLVQADVGTAPNEIPVNGMLGDMAYQSSDGVSMGTVSADEIGVGVSDPSAKIDIATAVNTNGLFIRDDSDNSITHNLYIDGSGNSQTTLYADGQAAKINLNTAGSTYFTGGRVGIGTATPENYAAAANNLVVGSGSGSEGITIATGAASQGGIYFADGTSGGDAYRGHIFYDHNNDSFSLATGATVRWKISSSGHLISNGGLYGIDFGSGDILDTYEEGTFTPELADADTGGNVATTGSADGWYTRVGNLVHIAFRITNINTTGLTGANRMRIRNLPFDFEGTTFTPGSVIVDGISFSGMIVPTNVGGVGDNILTLTNFSGAGDVYVLISAISSGTADIYCNMSYLTDEA